jgi:hypothetical protein
MSWLRRFVNPIPTKGKPLTLKEAAAFILKLSKAEQSKPHCCGRSRHHVRRR